MADDPASGPTPVGVLAVGLAAACCGLPLLLGTGLAVGAAGLALGSVVVVAAGAVLAAWGWRRRRAVARCAAPIAGPRSTAEHDTPRDV